MVTATPGAIVRKHVALIGGQMLIIGKENGQWQVALWRKRRQDEATREISETLWNKARQAWLPAGQRRDDWVRFAYSSSAFLPAANTALAFSYPKVDIGEFQDYLRAVPWGSEVLG